MNPVVIGVTCRGVACCTARHRQTLLIELSECELPELPDPKIYQKLLALEQFHSEISFI